MSEEEEGVFREILGKVEGRRQGVFEAMVYAVEHSECSSRVLQMVMEHCSDADSMLYLVSDILYNCNKVDVQYSWSYLPLIEEKAPRICERLKGSASAIEVISAWETWGVFDLKYLLGLRSIVEDWENGEVRETAQIYGRILGKCERYYVKNKCKGFGQDTGGGVEEQVTRVVRFVNYLMVSKGIKDQWIYVNIRTSGTLPSSVIEEVDRVIDVFGSWQFGGESFSAEEREVIKKLIVKYPGTYVSQHR